MPHVLDGRTCLVGHKLAKDLVTCEKCKEILSYPYHLHVNSRNKEALLDSHSMKWVPYSVEDWRKIIRKEWDTDRYPWEPQYSSQPGTR